MFVLILISLLNHEVNCYVIPISRPIYSKQLIKCVTNIVTDYFAPHKVLTYVGNKQDDDEFLRAIHDSNVVSIVSRRSSRKLAVPHEGYLISSQDYATFIRKFPNLLKESTWNPEARFLIVIRGLENHQLRDVFNRLLIQHVNNVIVVNATEEAHLYTYNPFDNYNCGKQYDNVISTGKCSEAHKHDLYPDKYVTELRNCTFTVAIPDSPPYTILATVLPTDIFSRYSYGVEPYLLQLIGDIAGFKLNIFLDENYNVTYSTVSLDMEASGPLKMLQNNTADVILGGLVLIPSRAVAFYYIYDLLPYVDEIRFVVKQASIVPIWKNVYLEFNSTVWVLIVLSIVFYSMIMMALLRADDKSLVVMKLIDNLLGHGSKIQYQATMRAIFTAWIWFAYLINAFYQSSLVSLTTHPAMENQISTEEDIMHHNLKPCFSDDFVDYYAESTQSHLENAPGCHTTDESLSKVMFSDNYYTIDLYGLLQYNIHNFLDDYGDVRIYTLKNPYSKVIYSMYFYKGFPLLHDLRYNALRLREMGLVDKAMSDMNFLKKIKHHYKAKSFESRCVIPWFIYIIGCTVAAVTLLVEILSTYKL